MNLGLNTVPLFDDEHLGSYVSRLARANGRKRSKEFCRDLGFDIWRLQNGEQDEIERLSHLCGLPSEKLTFHAIQDAGRPKGVVFRGMHYESQLLDRGGVRFCPSCFRADQASSDRMPGTRLYGRFTWFVEGIRTCPIHECALVQFTDRKHTLYRYDFLSQLEIAQVSSDTLAPDRHQELSDFERFLVDRINGVNQHGAFLDPLSTWQAVWLCELFGKALIFGKDHSFHILNDAERLRASSSGYRFLSEGDNGFQRLLDLIRAQPSNTKYGRLFNGLIKKGLGISFRKEMRALIDKHDENFESSPSLVADAVSKLEVAAETIQRATATLAKAAPALQPASASSTHHDQALQIIEHSLAEKQAIAVLKCSEDLFQEMERFGIVQAVFNREPKTSELRAHQLSRYSCTEVERVRRDIELKSPVSSLQELKDRGLLSVRTASIRTGCAGGQIIDMVLRGQLLPAARLKEGRLDAALHIDIGKLKRMVSHDPGFSIEEVGRRLLIREEDVQALVEMDAISAHSFGAVGFLMFAPRDVEAFTERYISMTEIRRKYKKALTWTHFRKFGFSRLFPIQNAVLDRKKVEEFISNRGGQT